MTLGEEGGMSQSRGDEKMDCGWGNGRWMGNSELNGEKTGFTIEEKMYGVFKRHSMMHG